jgi:hypothetical protein
MQQNTKYETTPTGRIAQHRGPNMRASKFAVTKCCADCKDTLPVDAFRLRAHSTGPYRQSVCGPCERARDTRYKARHRARKALGLFAEEGPQPYIAPTDFLLMGEATPGPLVASIGAPVVGWAMERAA